MAHKILVVNGHGAKRINTINIQNKHAIVTPGDANDSYIVSFDNMHRHLEEMTSRGKLWPIKAGAKHIQWKAYQDTAIHDISISPLQHNFNFKRFAADLLANTTGWNKLTVPPHSPIERGALFVRNPSGEDLLLEGEALVKFLLHPDDNFRPVFFCDKELGKIKPLGNISLGEIYNGIDLIEEFKATGTALVVATCSPDMKATKQIVVQTAEVAQNITDVLPQIGAIEKPVEAKVDIKNIAQELALAIGARAMIPRVQNYRPGDAQHNERQPWASFQFEFINPKDKDLFEKILIQHYPNSVSYSGISIAGHPIVQVKPNAMEKVDLHKVHTEFRMKQVWEHQIEKPVEVKVDIKSIAQELALAIGARAMIPRVQNYRPGDAQHNERQPWASFQFEFINPKDKDLFEKILIQHYPNSVSYSGISIAGHPIVQVKPNVMEKVDLHKVYTEFSSMKQVWEHQAEGISFDLQGAKSSLQNLKILSAITTIISNFRTVAFQQGSLEDLKSAVINFKQHTDYELLLAQQDKIPNKYGENLLAIQVIDKITEEAERHLNQHNFQP